MSDATPTPAAPAVEAVEADRVLLDQTAVRMAQELDVSVATARRSLENLLRRGLIEITPTGGPAHG